MKKKKLNNVLSLKKETVADLSLYEQKDVKGGACTELNTGCKETNLPAWTCYFPTFCYPSPVTQCAPTECTVPCDVNY